MNIDIIIPVFNHADHLARCLNSAIAQTRAARQIICVDDASTDPRVKGILQQFAASHSQVKVIFLESNQGICHAQNVAVAAAGAEYLAFLDCDDWLREDALQTVAARLQKEPAGYAFSDRIDVDEKAQTQTRRAYGGQPQLQAGKQHQANLLDNMVASHLKVIKKELIDAVGGFAEGTDGVQDWDVALKISEIAPLLHVPEAVYFHRVHTGQNSSWDKTVNMKKTNEVRRMAQLRRFKRPVPGGEPRLPALLQMLRQTSPAFFKTLSGSDILLCLDAQGQTHLVPQTRPCVQNLLRSVEVREALVFSKRHLFIELLKDLWAVPKPLLLGFHVNATDGQLPTIDAARWSNSYFDYLVCGSPEAHVALLGYGHAQLQVLVSEEATASA